MLFGAVSGRNILRWKQKIDVPSDDIDQFGLIFSPCERPNLFLDLGGTQDLNWLSPLFNPSLTSFVHFHEHVSTRIFH